MTKILPHLSGVYMIVCKYSEKIYIGSTNDFQKRWRDHRYELNRNKHRNAKLQHAWNKYGQENFRFLIIEECSNDILFEREQYYLDAIQPFRESGFNIAINAEKSTLGHIHSPETRAKLGVNKGRKFSAEVRAKVSAAGKGRKPSQLTLERSKAVVAKPCIITFPDGSEVYSDCLSDFCRTYSIYKLDISCLARVARGEQHNHKGFKCRYVESTDSTSSLSDSKQLQLWDLY